MVREDWKGMKYLQNPDLFKIITEEELPKRIYGESKSIKAIFLSLCSVWVKNSEIPLNTLVSSESSAGKSYVCKNIIKIFPKEMVVYRTKITPEAFTYLNMDVEDWSWDGKIFYLEDISQSILESATFKVMCSEGSTATIVLKQRAVNIEIQGKPIMLVTTARTNPNTEILNRFQIISLDESEEQTERIVFGIAADKEKEMYNPYITKALGQLKREEIVIPYALNIANFIKSNFHFKQIRFRRDFSRLLDLIRCSATLHQYQRERCEKTGRIIANVNDYEIARRVINYIKTSTFKGLTHRLKKAFDCCKELNKFTAKEIHAKFPIVNQKMWYNYLDQLCERAMLKSELGTEEGVRQKVTFFYVDEDSNFKLPKFKYLSKNITKVTLVTKDTIVTKVTKDKDNCNNCNNCNEKDQNKGDYSEDFS